MNAVFGRFQDNVPPVKARLVLTDPPYNIGHDYGPVNDKQKESDYVDMMGDFARWAYTHTQEDAILAVVHYPRFFFRWGYRTFEEFGGWEYRQQVRWCYSSNIGMSKRKWTTASREILFLTKGNPWFDSKADPEPYLNPTDKRVRALIEAGSPGRAPYDWWFFDLQKNVGADHAGYANQLPRPLLRRAILAASRPGDVVADPFAGTGSTLSVAQELNRVAWGCDANPQAPCLTPAVRIEAKVEHRLVHGNHTRDPASCSCNASAPEVGVKS